MVPRGSQSCSFTVGCFRLQSESVQFGLKDLLGCSPHFPCYRGHTIFLSRHLVHRTIPQIPRSQHAPISCEWRCRVFLCGSSLLVPAGWLRRETRLIRMPRRCFGMRNQLDLAVSGWSVEGTWRGCGWWMNQTVRSPLSLGEGSAAVTVTCPRRQQRSLARQHGSSTAPHAGTEGAQPQHGAARARSSVAHRHTHGHTRKTKTKDIGTKPLERTLGSKTRRQRSVIRVDVGQIVHCLFLCKR